MHERAPSLRKRFAPDRPRCWRARNWRRRAAEVAHRRLKSMPCSYFFVSLRYPPVMLISGLSRPRASAFAARFPLIGSSISFCPAAALRGFLPFAGSAPRSFAMLRFRASIRSTTFSPFGRAFAAIGLPHASAPSSSTCCARPPRARPKPSASQSAKSSEHLRPPNAPTISETHGYAQS